jgi:oxygen-dependent protoporphyrinogen oxidase
MAGLAAAGALAGRAEVTVFEATEGVGGKLRIGPLGIDEGAESFLARRPEGLDAAAAAGVALAAPGTTSASVWTGRGLRPLPAGTLLGVPTDLWGARGVLGVAGVARAALDRVLPRTRFADDPAVGALVRARVGGRVVDRLVDPLLGGVYAGSADGLSLRVTVPQLVPALQERSLLAAARRLRPTPAPDAGPVFSTPVDGMGSFAAALARNSGAEIVVGSPVRSLGRSRGGWSVDGGRFDGQFDGIVVALPAAPTAKLLAPLGVPVPDVPYASVAIATFVFPSGTELPPGSGLLVPPSRGRAMKAATFLSQKWPHLAGRAGGPIVRASAGRFGDVRDLQRPDVELLGVLAADFAAATGVLARPVAAALRRWGGGLPQYRPGHLDRVAAFRSALPEGLAVAGAAWDGVGVPACLRSGRLAAEAVLETVLTGAASASGNGGQ